MGSKSDGGRGAAIAEARQAADRAAAQFAGIEIPDVEKQKLLLEQFVNEGILTPEELQDTQLAGITLDPRYKQAQMDALKEMQGLGQTGLGAEDRYALSQIQDQLAAKNQASQAGVLRDMAERGTLDSGEQLAAQLSSSQAAAQTANQQGQALAAQAAQSRRQALEQASGMAGQLRQADYGQQSDVARARDVAAQFNAQNRYSTQQQNLANKQRLSEANVGQRNTQQQYNKELLQKQYENQMAKAQGMANAYGMQANTAMTAAQLAQPKKGLGGVIGTLAGAAIGGYAGAQSGQGAAGAQTGANVGGATGSYFSEGGIQDPYKQAEYNNPQPHFTNWLKDQFSPEQPTGMADLRKFDEQALKQPTQEVVPKQESAWAKYAGLASALDSNLQKSQAQPEQQRLINIPQNTKYFNDGGVKELNPDAQKELLAVARGDIMPEDSSSGRIIGGNSPTGDHLPDRINSHEMVLNVPQQDLVKKELDEKTAQNKGFMKIMELLGKRNG